MSAMKEEFFDIQERLEQFILPEFLPITPAQIQCWMEEANDNGGMVEVPAAWAISGHTELFSL